MVLKPKIPWSKQDAYISQPRQLRKGLVLVVFTIVDLGQIHHVVILLILFIQRLTLHFITSKL